MGNSHRATVTEIDPVDWESIMELNVKSMMLTSRYAIPVIKQNAGGSIINIASIASFRASKSTVYTASKAAVIDLTRIKVMEMIPLI